MHITGQRCQEADIPDVLFLSKDGLIQMSDAPALRNRVIKQLCQRFRGLPREVVAPGPEGNQLLVFLVEHHVSMHHRAEAEGCRGSYGNSVLTEDILSHLAVAVLNAGPDFLRLYVQTLSTRLFSQSWLPEAIGNRSSPMSTV